MSESSTQSEPNPRPDCGQGLQLKKVKLLGQSETVYICPATGQMARSRSEFSRRCRQCPLRNGENQTIPS